jgi:hypothetical protein
MFYLFYSAKVHVIISPPSVCTNSEARGNISIHRVNFFAIRFDVQRITFTMTTNKTKKYLSKSQMPLDDAFFYIWHWGANDGRKNRYVFLLNCNQFTSEIYYSFPFFLVVHIVVANCHVKLDFQLTTPFLCLCVYQKILFVSLLLYHMIVSCRIQTCRETKTNDAVTYDVAPASEITWHFSIQLPFKEILWHRFQRWWWWWRQTDTTNLNTFFFCTKGPLLLYFVVMTNEFNWLNRICDVDDVA